jgi:DNA-binding beta-propeller fold protein YncE
MPLKYSGNIELPAHIQRGGFDHAAVDSRRGFLYVAHMANDAVDIIDTKSNRFLYSIPNLPRAAGILISEESNLVFVSNHGDDSIRIFLPGHESEMITIGVGVCPNGLAYSPAHNLLLVANVGNPTIVDSMTISLVDVGKQKTVASILTPGRTRWTVYDSLSDSFYVNISEPPQILVIKASCPDRIDQAWTIPTAGLHGLDIDVERGKLFCACDSKKLIVLDIKSGSVLKQLDISGGPDVVFYNKTHKHLFIAIGNPGVIDVFDTESMKLIETVSTGQGAHTIGFDSLHNRVYAFIPENHSANIYDDEV